jgi:arylsulfatase A-like enzyme
VHRRQFLLGATAAAGLLSLGGVSSCISQQTRRYGSIELLRRKPATDAPNVLFISVDDCNDWVGFLNPHPGTLTPNLDALAARSLSFDHAYCVGPMCGPARTGITFGTHPFQNGVYDHTDASNKAYRDMRVVTPSLIDDFWAAGYDSVGAGKIYHLQLPDRWDRYRLTDFYLSGHRRDDPGADPARYDPDWISPYDGLPIGRGENFSYDEIDFGPSGVTADQEPDGKAARWVRQQLRNMPREPFFLGFGTFIPHEPWRLPQRFFDLHPLEDIVVPQVTPDDLDDLPTYAREGVIDRLHQFERIQQSGIWERAVQAYQAAISFADDCVGIILNELASSRFADDTVVVAWSDHGFHLGEKMHIAKFTLWERATRVPFLLHVPGRFDHEQHVDAPVSTIDIGPTLSELCGIEPATPYAGGSLLPIVEDPRRADARPPITTWQQGNHAVRQGPWRYIRYRTGERELYDHRQDPDEFVNLASRPGHGAQMAKLDAFLPDP